MDTMTLRFVAIFCIILVFMLVIPFIVFFLMTKKYGNRMPGKVAVVFIFCMITYLVLFFNFAHLLIPTAWQLQPTEVYKCEWKTIYVEKTGG